MPWRNWSIVVVLILSNYIVFSLLGSYAFPAAPESAPTHVAQPTFTPGGVRGLTRVPPLSYPFLTPTVNASVTAASSTVTTTISVTRTIVPSAAITGTVTPVDVAATRSLTNTLVPQPTGAISAPATARP